ncbi:PQ-loop-domain-containing protein [Cystobasidium minutum MCA 4210]|uniref:PQ-loop-domain-containing protein n=1 Tax=Cystobasidium minutum MCA 4210 TaxID=1397322 RepID=UPI0034CE3BCE|eukprot:jgi/Rhomi1/171497/fgenesh1_kg.4_\
MTTQLATEIATTGKAAVGQAASATLGWISTIAWSVSFYPQAILNYRRHSVEGLSFDFVYLNVQGFLAYSIYNIGLFASKPVRKEYQRRHDGHSPSVRGNDVAFAVHALAISLVTLFQTFLYDRGHKQSISSFSAFFITATSIIVAVSTVATGFGSLAWLDLLYYLSYLKSAISFLKYVPQAWMNYKRKSTVGWSIHNIILDFTGGSCSLAQLFLDAHLNDDWGSIRGNPAKLILAVLAVSFDILFLVQHYILYRHSNAADSSGKSGARGGEEEHGEEEEREPDERTRLV